ncbi:MULTISPECIES: TonB-dependent siderophore receptor [unclassified Halomonas]|uniref:TonB-dependent siderophore receptor n=1 Tax=unclassified Halomonas TaxID=2609666 RepID=UPI00209E9911|nr:MULTISPECIES: TonB-dependent siderophore receptor [unclassified Halomonas]MCP1314032.1 TonB-dependent siderophore receptor [Halomonas sp. 707D7]MCP1326206.1 TonB-dependent siderophore receptor [Halomonas sp. 707D4]
MPDGFQGKHRLALAITIASHALATPVIAQSSARADDDVALDTVQVTAEASGVYGYIDAERESRVGKLAVPISEQPFSMSVIDQEFIQDTGAKSIQDTLLYTPGVHAGNFGFDTRTDSAKVRGLDAGRYLDGLRQVYGAYNTVRTNPYALESVEVLRGPSSMLYGQADLGGIINGVSKLPQAEQRGEVWAQVGSFDRQQLAVDVTGAADEEGQFLYRLVALARDSGTQVDHVDDDGYLLAPSFTWRPSDETQFTLLINRQENKGQVSAQFLPQVGTLEPGSQGFIGSQRFVGEPGWDRYDREKTETTLFFDQTLTDDWAFSATARYTESSTQTREHWVDIPSVPGPNGEVNRTIFTADNQTRILNLDARLTGSFSLGATEHTLLAGIDRQDARWSEDNYSSVAGGGGPINIYDPTYGDLRLDALDPRDRPDNDIEQVGVYLADHVEFGPVVLSAGLRRDWAENRTLAVEGPDTVSDEAKTTGRLGLMYRFENGFSPYVSYSEAFAMNLGSDGTDDPSPLKPTTGDQNEIGFKYVSPDQTLALSAAYFDITQENRISDGLTPGGVQQVGAKVDGIEVQLNKRWQQLETQLAYTHLDARNDATGLRLPFVAEEQVSWWNRLYMGTNWRVGAGVRYVGDTVGASEAPVVPSSTLYDAMVGYTLDDWDFSVDIKNFTDEEYVSWCRYDGSDCGYGDRRSVTANVRYQF